VSLRLSVPVFVAPVHGTPSAHLQWQLRPLPGGDVEVDAVNEGTAHLQVADFDVQVGADTPLHAKTSKYLLPGGHMMWQLKPETLVASQGAVVIHGHSDQGDFTAPIARSGL
jgi:P pilus assembly chaperone PapD